MMSDIPFSVERWLHSLRNAGEGILDLVYPRECISCGDLVEDSGCRYVCKTCVRRLFPVQAPHCMTCGFPFFGYLAEDADCPHCQFLRPYFRVGRTAFLFQGPLKPFLLSWKYRGARWLESDLPRLLSPLPYYRSFFENALLVPVPLHLRKEKDRGFNQSYVLTDILASLGKTCTVGHLLERSVDTPTQTRLDRQQREKNLKNAFDLKKGAAVPENQRIILVDDVFTTGATLNSCARVLRKAGARFIDVATLAHG